jgi:hypothetical protein
MFESLEHRKLMSASASTVAAAEDPAVRTVSISDASGTDAVRDVTEIGTPQVVFTLTLSIPVSETDSPHPSVRVTTHDGTAKAGEDYRPIDVAVPLFQFANQTFVSTTVAVDIIGDFDDEPTETFTVTLSDPVGVIIGDGEAVGTIVNAPAPTPVKFGGADGPLTKGISIDLRGPGSGLAYYTLEALQPAFIQLDGTTKATTLRIAGDAVLPDVRVNGDMKSFGAKNVDLAGVLTFNGNVPKITLDDVTDSRIKLTGSGAVSLVANDVKGLRLDAAGPIKSIRVDGWESQTDPTPVEDNLITTPTLTAFSARSAVAVNITADTIGRISAGKGIGGTIRATQSIGAISAQGFANAAIFAGVSPDLVVGTLPDDAADFVNPAASIGSVITHAPTRNATGVNMIGFFGSDIAAPTIGALKLGRAEHSSDATDAEGVAAHSIRSLSASTADDRVSLRNLDTPSDSKTFDEFVVRVIWHSTASPLI